VPERTSGVVVFENRFPSLRPEPPAPAVEGTALWPVRPARGVCEVVVYSPDHESSLAAEPVEQIYKVVRVWADRYEELGGLDFVKYVHEFENRGAAVGVTLTHPHGQIYAYPFVPPVVARELERSREHEDRTGRCLLCDVLAGERRDGRRVVAENASFAAYVPPFARWPYEVHVASTRHLQALTDMHDDEQRDLAAILKTVLVAYDRLFDAPFPYVMAVHQRPTDGLPYDHYHFHVELYPPLRTETKLKFLAGSELGAGVFVNDTLPEGTAAELRALAEPAVWRREALRHG
jgi:UDPglucose--hexose-1-phosphate uridylyltransferase